MRLDKYLKVSRIIKRRTVAKDVCDGGKVKINGKVAKAGAEIKIGDILEKIKQIIGIDVGECTPDGKFSLDATRCIGACGLAPVLTVNDEVYGKLTVDDVDGILEKYMDK